MQVPKRRSEQFRKYSQDGPAGSAQQGGPIYLTQAGIAKLQRKLDRLEADLPAAIKEVERTKEYGDFSENAEYKEAKHKMRRMHAQIFKIKHQLDKAEVIDTNINSNWVEIGSIVTVEINGIQKDYQILGSMESDPSGGKISHHSPIGKALLGHQAGDSVTIHLKDKDVEYKIIRIQ